MSESNGYTSLEEIEREYRQVRVKAIEIDGKKFELTSLDTEAVTRLVFELEKNPKTRNQRAIIAVVTKPEFTREHIPMLSKLDSAFVARLATECMEHIGIDALSVTEVEDEEKN